MKIKNRDLIKRLLISVAIENGGSVNLKDIETFLDEGFRSGELIVSFTDKTLKWNVNEDNIKAHMDGFHSVVEKVDKLGHDKIRIEFDSRCETCGGELHKIRVELNDKSIIRFRCSQCMLNYKFNVSSTVELDDVETGIQTKF